MANIYPYFDAGTWESFTDAVEVNGRSTLQRSADIAFAGTRSGKIIMTSLASGAFLLTPLKSAPGLAANIRPIILTMGSKYRISMRVRTPSGTPIGSDDLPVAITPVSNRSLNVAMGESFTFTTVGACKDAWVEVQYTFINFYPDSSINSSLHVSLVPANNGTIFSGLGITRAGTINNGGILYFDNVTLEEIPNNTCDIQVGSPAFTKTNESGVDLNNGTINLFASSVNHVLQYSIDGVSYQLSSNFTGVAPGNYTGRVRSSAQPTCNILIPDIIITEFAAPPDPPPVIPGTLQVFQEPMNRNNFINWFETTGDTGFDSVEYQGCCWDIPVGYRDGENKIEARIHAPIVVVDEMFSFYINFEGEDFNDPNFADFRLALINNGGVVVEDLEVTLNKDLLPDGVAYNIWAEVTLEVGPEPGQHYRLAIYNANTNAIILVSNALELLPADEACRRSVRVQYRNKFNYYKYLYANEGMEDYLNTIRLRLYRLEFQFEGNVTQYRAISTGILRNVSFELDKFYSLEAYWFNDLAHEAMGVFQAHGLILINEMQVIVKDLYRIEWDPKKELNKGKIGMYEQKFSTVNRFGQNSLTVVGSEDPLLLGDGGGRIKL